MKLRRPCEHDLYDAHGPYELSGAPDFRCPGGVFLPDDTLIIEKVDGEWPQWASFGLAPDIVSAAEVLDALSVREAEVDKNQMGMW